MNIRIEKGAKVQITDKPIVNVFGDVNIGEKSKSRTDVEDAEFTEVKDTAEEQVEPKEEKLNTKTPCVHLQQLLLSDWFEQVCTDKKTYHAEWRNKLVADLMVSEHGAYIAKLWKHKDKIQTIKGKFVGTLVLAGVLKDNKLAASRAILGIDKNTRDEDEKKEPSTFANYMGQGKNEPYLYWIKDYVNNTKPKD